MPCSPPPPAPPIALSAATEISRFWDKIPLSIGRITPNNELVCAYLFIKFSVIQGIGSTIVSVSKCERDCNNFSTGTQTFENDDEDTASEEFPLLDVSSREKEADFKSISKPLVMMTLTMKHHSHVLKCWT
jgi:hypothetical protein